MNYKKYKNYFIYFIYFILFIGIILSIDYIMSRKASKINSVDLMNYLNTLYLKFENKFTNLNDTSFKYGADCIYCITMPKRKEYARNKMNELGTNCVFLDAVKPGDLTEKDYIFLSSTYNFSFLNYYQMFMKKTKLALQLSHVMCYLHAIKNNYQTVIIFEDDIIQNDLTTLSEAIEQFKSSDFRIFYLGYCLLDCSKKYTKNNYLVHVDGVLCLHAVAYNVKYLSDIINNIFYMSEPIDNMLMYYTKKHKNSACVSVKAYFEQNGNLGTTLDYPFGNLETKSCDSLLFK